MEPIDGVVASHAASNATMMGLLRTFKREGAAAVGGDGTIKGRELGRSVARVQTMVRGADHWLVQDEAGAPLYGATTYSWIKARERQSAAAAR